MLCKTCRHEHDEDPNVEMPDGRRYSDPNFCISRLSSMLESAQLQILSYEAMKAGVELRLEDEARAYNGLAKSYEDMKIQNDVLTKALQRIASLSCCNDCDEHPGGKCPCDVAGETLAAQGVTETRLGPVECPHDSFAIKCPLCEEHRS